MDFSYNSDWNNFVKTECEKLRKKGHTFDAEGTHMKIIGEKYQKKLAREAKAKSKQSQPSGAKSKKQQNNEDIVSCINMMNIASNCCTLSGYVNEVSRCEGIYQEWLVTNPSKANLLHDELIRHQRQVATRKAKSKSDDERKAQKNEAKVKAILEKVRIETEAKAKQHKEREIEMMKAYDKQQREQWDFEARRRGEMLRIRAKQQEELAKVQKEAEAKRIQDIAVAKALQDLLEVRDREAKTKEEERIRAVIEAEKHREELEKANARAKEAEELVKAMERDQIAKSNAKAKELEEIVNAANAIANEREKIVKSNQEEELKKIKAQLEKEREEFEKFKSLTIERENLAAVNSSSMCNSLSKFAIALQGEIERRKHDKNPIKFKFQRKIKFVSKLEIALKEVLSRRGKIQTS